MRYLCSKIYFVLSVLFTVNYCVWTNPNYQYNDVNFYEKALYQIKVDDWLSDVSADYLSINAASADLAWSQSVAEGDVEVALEKAQALGKTKRSWRLNICAQARQLKPFLRADQKRALYLLCRGPDYTDVEIQRLTEIQSNMYEIYTDTRVCDKNRCLRGEPDLEALMAHQNASSEELLWAWEGWHNAVGSRIKEYYPDFVRILNAGAKRNGYDDIGEAWREELEMPKLEEQSYLLYKELQPLYTALHAVIRHKLHKKYGDKIIDPYGPIPAHLLGNMWAQDWSSLSSLIIDKDIDLDEKIKQKKWSITDMVEIAEDFYVSLTLPAMTVKFWNNSHFQYDNEKNITCHGTAANMFKKDDFRILMCGTNSFNDLYVIHHEMGHIEYYMAYEDLPAFFQEGANSAIQESIGDTIMLGVMSPLHLHRLGLINDERLMNPAFDIVLLLHQALSKLPQIPYAYLIDKYRWEIFRGTINEIEYNEIFWDMNERLRGIKAPIKRNESYFDAGAKFHIPDNTPYIRYFLSYFLQVQLYKGMCEITVFGKTVHEFPNRHTVPMLFPLHRCDIYGSKDAGKKLRKMLELGASQSWSEIIKTLIGQDFISVQPILEYYEPLYKMLQNEIKKNKIPVGW